MKAIKEKIEKRKSKKKKLIYFAELYLNNALSFLDNNNIEGAKSEIKWALRKSNMRIYNSQEKKNSNDAHIEEKK